jgi:hypothetical protein
VIYGAPSQDALGVVLFVVAAIVLWLVVELIDEAYGEDDDE